MATVRESAAKPSRVLASLFARLPGMLEVIARLSIGACDDSTLSMVSHGLLLHGGRHLKLSGDDVNDERCSRNSVRNSAELRVQQNKA
jgi:hypothetical protein